MAQSFAFCIRPSDHFNWAMSSGTSKSGVPPECCTRSRGCGKLGGRDDEKDVLCMKSLMEVASGEDVQSSAVLTPSAVLAGLGAQREQIGRIGCTAFARAGVIVIPLFQFDRVLAI